MRSSTLQLPHAGGFRLHVRQRPGKGPTLLMLHYWGGSSHTWDPVIGALPAEVGCVAIDQRGWGASQGGADDVGMADLADDAQAVAELLGLERYVLVGHSMGGRVAQVLASRRPRGLVGLVLVASAPAAPMPLPEEQRQALVHAYDTPESIAHVLDHVLTAHPLSHALRSRVIEDSLGGSASAKRAWPLRGSREDHSAHVDRIGVPSLVIAGGLDCVEPLDLQRGEVLARIPGATLTVLEGVGHLLPLEAPAPVAAALGAFLGRIR